MEMLVSPKKGIMDLLKDKGWEENLNVHDREHGHFRRKMGHRTKLRYALAQKLTEAGIPTKNWSVTSNFDSIHLVDERALDEAFDPVTGRNFCTSSKRFICFLKKF